MYIAQDCFVLQNMSRRGQRPDGQWEGDSKRGAWKGGVEGHDERGRWEAEEGEILSGSGEYSGFKDRHGGYGKRWRGDFNRRKLEDREERKYEPYAEKKWEDNKKRSGERDLWSERWDSCNQNRGHRGGKWEDKEKFRRGDDFRERKDVGARHDRHHREDKWGERREAGSVEGGRSWNFRAGKSESRDIINSKSQDADNGLNCNDEIKGRNIVCHSISVGSSRRNSEKEVIPKKREGTSLSEEQRSRGVRRGQSSMNHKNNPKQKKVKKEGSHSLEELETALRMVEKEEEAAAMRKKLTTEIEGMKKRKLEKAREDLSQYSILVNDFPSMDEYFGRFGVIGCITRVSDGFSRIDFINVEAADKAKQSKEVWPKNAEEFDAVRAKSVRPVREESREEGETSSTSSEDEYAERWSCVECQHDNFSWSKECSQCRASQHCEDQCTVSSEDRSLNPSLDEEPSKSEMSRLKRCSNGEGVERKEKASVVKILEMENDVPVVDLASSEEDITEVSPSPLELKLKLFSEESEEMQDEFLRSMGIVRYIDKKQLKSYSDDSDAGLYSDGAEIG